MTALLTIGLAATRISEIMAPPTKPKGEIIFRQQSLVSARADFVSFRVFISHAAAPKLQRRDTNVCELESAPSG